MVDGASVWPTVSEHADRLLQLLKEGVFEGSARDAAVASMYWRTRRLYEAALILLKAQLPEEASIIARSLFEAAMRLMQLAADPADRDVLIIGWVGDSIQQREGLFRTAKSVGLASDIDEHLERFSEERRRLQAYAAGRPWKRFHTPGEAARRFNRADDFWSYELAHESVHGSDAASLFSTRARGNERRMHARVSEPSVLGAFAHFAARAMADAATATYKILGWSPIPDFEEPVRAMEQLLAEDQAARSRARGRRVES
jgi:Family of unknown function (DUF5677)